ncbi:hypothetical protein IW152_003366 [Coemansia sp. BCRC 34962]|nr:hypothetical protein IW152_003366 [Coemansia sp. BCRC 34962]
MGGQQIDSVVHGLQAIHIAASQDDPAVVEMLLQSGADINARSLSLLQSVSHNQLELLDEGRTDEPSKAKAGTRTQRGAKGWSGRAYPKESVLSSISSPLNYTAGLYSMDAANIDAPVEHAASHVGHGVGRAGSTCSEYGGATPLHFAVANGRLECADILIRSGASLDIADYYGNTPEALALARSDSIIAAMLQRGRESMASSLSLGLSETSGLASLVAYPYEPTAACYSSLAPQLPSPSPSVLCHADCSPKTEQPPPATDLRSPGTASAANSKAAAPTSSRLAKSRRQEAWQSACRIGVPTRRHTAGEAESSTRYAYVSPSPTALSWLKTKHRGTSPIGIRSLSASTGQHCRLGRSASASGRLVNKGSGDSSHRAVADSPPPAGFLRHMANLRDVGHTGTAGPYDSRRFADGYGRRARFAVAGIASGLPPYESGNFGGSNGCALSRSDSASSRRERSYTDSVVEKAWRSYLEYDEGGDAAHDFAASNASLEDGGLRPVPEPWMWKQAAMAVRNRRSQSLSTKAQQASPGPAPARHKRLGRLQ